MTLRTRLVVGLVVLVAAGLGVFGVVTYGLYARSQYERLDTQIRNSVPLVTSDLYGGRDDDRPGPPDGDDHRPPQLVPPGTYGVLLDSSGAVINDILYNSDATPPVIDASAIDHVGQLYTSGMWRILVTPSSRGDGSFVVVASPTTQVESQLHELVAIEAIGSVVLLAILAAGAWLLLRRGLRPLEEMATTARSITAGDLSQRVEPADTRSEVGQLGLALNTMLGEIEVAFREREATEIRLRQFLADASHELRTPLTSIQGFAELFHLGAEQDHVNLPIILRRIEQETARMKVLVEELLLLARLDETSAAEREPVDLAVLAADACSDAVAADPSRAVTLDAPDPVVMNGAVDHLRQAIGNLVANAIKHTQPGTPLEVTAARRDGEAVVIVRDHGPGLDDEALHHVFDRFWQADRARAGSGAGLGLAIVAAVVAEHGGAATAANADGGGAVFTVALPVDAT
jgi:two-component system, OmpR family, sensor kinase